MTKECSSDRVELLSVPAGDRNADILGMNNLADCIRRQMMPDEHATPMFDFFKNCSVQSMAIFQDAHRISDGDLKLFYEAHIKSRQPNSMLEDMLDYVEKFAGVAL